jgi:nucleotide-binding universal stress UspA family protein/CheY-like chemotaxis protein
MVGRILVPVDRSIYTSRAITFAAQTANQEDAEVHLLHVVKKARIPTDLEEYMEVERIQEPPIDVYLKLMGNQIIEDAEKEARKRGIRNIKTSIIQGDPGNLIVEYAAKRKVDMIVMGSSGLGSVAGAVCRHANRQVCVIVRRSLLDGKKVLIVDDEPDVLETVEELLPMCRVTGAATFQEAKELLSTEHFDMAILDIMGVNGFDLLKLAKQKRVPAVMLTSHALSPETTAQAYREGAASYVPKEKMGDIVTYLNDVLEAKERGKDSWWRWFERFGSFYERKFGPDLSRKG